MIRGIAVTKPPKHPTGSTLMQTQAHKAAAFRALHDRDGAFLIPNPWDRGTARLLAHLGFEALATTSDGYAFSAGRRAYAIGRDEPGRVGSRRPPAPRRAVRRWPAGGRRTCEGGARVVEGRGSGRGWREKVHSVGAGRRGAGQSNSVLSV